MRCNGQANSWRFVTKMWVTETEFHNIAKAHWILHALVKRVIDKYHGRILELSCQMLHATISGASVTPFELDNGSYQAP